MDTERSLSAAMKAEIHAWMYDEDSEQQLADRLARLAEQPLAILEAQGISCMR